jgi:hypothetical protein
MIFVRSSGKAYQGEGVEILVERGRWPQATPLRTLGVFKTQGSRWLVYAEIFPATMTGVGHVASELARTWSPIRDKHGRAPDSACSQAVESVVGPGHGKTFSLGAHRNLRRQSKELMGIGPGKVGY